MRLWAAMGRGDCEEKKLVRGRKEKGKCNYAVEIVVWKKEGLKMMGFGGIGERVVKKNKQ